jgi:hypothetical protein
MFKLKKIRAYYKPGSSKERIWKEISKGNCANGSVQSDGQSRCQLSAVRSDKICHCGLAQVLYDREKKVINTQRM